MAGKYVNIVFGAGLLARLPSRREHPAPLEMDRLRVEFWIFDQQFQVKMAEIRTGPTLHNVPGIAHWIGVLVRPGVGFLEPDRVDDERTALPASDRFAEISGVGVFVVFAAVRRNHPERSILIKKDSGPLNLQKLEPAVACIFSRDAAGQTAAFGVHRVLQ